MSTSRLEKLQTLLKTEPNDAFLNFGLAMELAKVGQFDECLAQFDRVQQPDPHYIAAYFQKGRTLLSMGDADRARAELNRGIAAATESGDLHARGEMEELLASM